jgi:hypothetical protein
MKRIAMLTDNEVQNIAKWDGNSAWNPPGFELIDITNLPHVDIGWIYGDGEFTPPPEEQKQEEENSHADSSGYPI